MKRANERLEMLRSGIGMPRERIVGPIAGNDVSRVDTQMSLFTPRVASAPHIKENASPDATVVTGALPGEPCETAAAAKVKHVSLGALSNYKIQKLTNKKVRAAGRVPKILVLRSRSAEIAEEPEPAQQPLPAPLPTVEAQARPAPIEESPAKHVVTVIPTPRKPRVRSPKVDEKKAEPIPAPKPLKVIRRRREETPKVFETVAKSLPRAMLEGINIEFGDNNHQQVD